MSISFRKQAVRGVAFEPDCNRVCRVQEACGLSNDGARVCDRRISTLQRCATGVLFFSAALYGSFLIGCAYITAPPSEIYLAVPFDNRPGYWNECSLDVSFDGRVWSNVRTRLYTAPSPALCRNASLFKLGSTYMMTYSSFLPSGSITGQSTSLGLASGSDPLHLTHLTEVSLASCCMGVETASPIVDETGELHVIVNAWKGQESGELKLWEVHNDRCTFADQSGCGSGWSDPVALQCATQSGCGNPDGSIRALDPSMVSMGGEYYLIAGGGAIIQSTPSSSITGPFGFFATVVPANAEASSAIQIGPNTWRNVYINTADYRPNYVETNNLASGVWGSPVPLAVPPAHSDSWGTTRFSDLDTMRYVLGDGYHP
jgi:hypothetical protein